MTLIVNEILQDANLLEKSVVKYEPEMADAGITGALVGSAAADLAEKDKRQKQAVEQVAKKTALQNQVMQLGVDALNKFQNAAKSAFGKDRTITKTFHIGADKPLTVKGMLRELAYMKDTAAEYVADLKKNGIKDADIAVLDTIAADLKEADADQEQAKKLQVNATADRDKALQVLKELMTKIRNTVKVVFAKNENVLNEFSTILNARNSKRTVPAPPPTPAATPAK